MRNRTGWLAAGLGLAIFALPALASAQVFAKQGELAVSAERLFGFVSSSDKQSLNGASQTTHYSTFTLLTNPLGPITTSYAIPRIGLDYFVIDGLTIGAAVGYFHASGSIEANGTSQDTATASGFLFAPRIGYAAMFSPVVGIWPRAGFTYLSASSESATGTNNTDAHVSALTLEAPLVISPVPHAGFLIGPTLDLGLGGSSKRTSTLTNITTTTDETATDIGVQAGLFVYF